MVHGALLSSPRQPRPSTVALPMQPPHDSHSQGRTSVLRLREGPRAEGNKTAMTTTFVIDDGSRPYSHTITKGSSTDCTDQLIDNCDGARRASVGNCLVCAGQHARQLQIAHCDNPAIQAWCSGPPPPAVVPVAPKELPPQYLRVDSRIPTRYERTLHHACNYPNEPFSCANIVR